MQNKGNTTTPKGEFLNVQVVSRYFWRPIGWCLAHVNYSITYSNHDYFPTPHPKKKLAFPPADYCNRSSITVAMEGFRYISVLSEKHQGLCLRYTQSKYVVPDSCYTAERIRGEIGVF